MFNLELAWGPNWLPAASVGVMAAVLVFLGAELLDRRWENSLKQTQCAVSSVKTEGRVDIVSSGRTSRRIEYSGKWVEDTIVEFQVEGGGRRRTVQPAGLFQVGQVRECWIAGDDMYLDLGPERLERRWNKGGWPVTVFLTSVLGWWAWSRLKNSGLDWWPF
jgi:hypothetical protein